MSTLNSRIPQYCKHKGTGQAVVTIDGRDIYLGLYGTVDSRSRYNQIVAEWLAAGRRLPEDPQAVTVAEVVAAFRRYARTYYKNSDGTISREADNYDEAVKPLVKLYGRLPAVEFGPIRLKAVREAMIADARVRTNINRHMSRIKSVFKWATSAEMIPPQVFHGLLSVSGLRQGRCEAKESDPVKPVPDEVVNATLPHLPSVVRAMVELQHLTGARPGEICSMRIGEVDRSTQIWRYCPAAHKTAHHGHHRTIFIGPRAQAVLKPFMRKLDPSAFIFSPTAALLEMRQRRSESRKTPLGQGNAAGRNIARQPKRKPGDHYDVHGYRRAIARATDTADLWAKGGRIVANDQRVIPRWNPHQLRHSAATTIRKRFGIEGAQHVLGHSQIKTTELYAEKNSQVAEKIAASVG
jgi:integrase